MSKEGGQTISIPFGQYESQQQSQTPILENPEYSQAVKDRLYQMNSEAILLRQKQAYIDELPKDSYVFLSYDLEGKVSLDQTILATHNDMEF